MRKHYTNIVKRRNIFRKLSSCIRYILKPFQAVLYFLSNTMFLLYLLDYILKVSFILVIVYLFIQVLERYLP